MTSRMLNVKESILGANHERAEDIRRLLDSRAILMVNLMSSSGSGKTSVIARTIDGLRDEFRIAVIQGDIASSVDSERITRKDVSVVQVNAAGGCHLDARMIKEALIKLDLDRIDLILIENVGNLICTADFHLGAQRSVVILSVPEGDDKAFKRPTMFVEADAVLVNKIDVLPYFDFRLDAFTMTIGGLNPSAMVLPVSAKTGEGFDRWLSWIKDGIRETMQHRCDGR